ncbi:MAG: GDSL-type esterase/lipase family protein [Bdellovibrionota bacterium]|nr:MAG: GDSL-type esterase/lipase family protein [Bdellovibrionota bacterium]
MRKFLLLIIAIDVLTSISLASACPLIDGMVDYNCDGELKIAVTGDSIVRGTTDKEGTYRNAGWVFDLYKHFPNATVSNQGVPGTTSQRLRRQFMRNLQPGISTYRSMKSADYVIIEVGTNEYWNYQPVSETIQGITRLRDYLMEFYEGDGRGVPLFVVATLTQSKRSFQNPFLLEVSKQLMRRRQSLNVLIPFHKLGTSIISKDLLHPSKTGYDRMAEFASEILLDKVLAQALANRPDADADGIYDQFEESLYGTDPTLADTDVDGVSDGEEVFTNGTDPLDPSSF